MKSNSSNGSRAETKPVNPRASGRTTKPDVGTEDKEVGSKMDTDLHNLFVDEIADVYSAENQLTKALPKMAKAANSDELREAFEAHLEETKGQIARLEEVAQVLGEKIKRKTCLAMKGLIEEAQELMEEEKDSSALDAALIAAAQKVEHYEIASYGTLCAWAKQMGHDEALALLGETLEEEKSADEKLTSIAESSANQEGNEDSEGEEEEESKPSKSSARRK